MQSQADGTRTFVFTDIEGSTRLWEADPVSMARALVRHNELLQTVFEAHGGHVFKTIGDAFCVALPSAVEAVKAAAEVQRLLKSEPWPNETPIKVRIALHTGSAEPRDGDYFGPVLNRLSRLLSLAQGGQVLLSGTTEAAAQPMPEGLQLRFLGVYRLRDLARAENVYGLYVSGDDGEPPSLRSRGGVPNNLPQEMTSFIGREKEVVETRLLLARTKVVTLVGAGGAGKTRLALQVASEAIEEHQDGVFFIDLSSIGEPALVATATAAALDLNQPPGRSVEDGIADYLRDRNVLLILDNCEHLLAACAQLCLKLVRSCPRVTVLTTSREALGIIGERSYRVPSLSLPGDKSPVNASTMLQFESVALFVERAKAGNAGFQVTDENAAPIAVICRCLDGIPLAIELAAARVRSLAVQQIASRLDDRFRLLTGGPRTALPRQQTLRALVDWSYDLLSDVEKTMLRRLAVFSGGWRLEDAEAVVAFNPIEAMEVIDLLTSLIDKSLVMFDGERYRLLETVRQYALEQLAGEERNEDENRHRAHYLRLAIASESQLGGSAEMDALDRLDLEAENLRAARDHARTASEFTASAQVSLVLAMLSQRRGYFADAVAVCELGLTDIRRAEPPDESLQARLTYERAGLYWDTRSLEPAETTAMSARVLFERLDDKRGMGRCENLLGKVAMERRVFDIAAMHYERAVELSTLAGDELVVAAVYNNLGLLQRRMPTEGAEERDAQLRKAEDYLVRARKLREKGNDARGLSDTLNNLGVVAFDRGDFDRAWDYYVLSISHEQRLNHTIGIGIALANLGEVAGRRGNHRQGVRMLAAAERILAERQSPLGATVAEMLKTAAETGGLAEADLEQVRVEIRGVPSIETRVDWLIEG